MRPDEIGGHAHVVGSLLRPDELHDAVQAHDAQRLDADGLQAVADRAVADAIRMQERAGLPVVTDGEMRRQLFYDPYMRGLRGLSREHPGATLRFRNEQGGRWSLTVPVSAVERVEPIEASPLLAEYRSAQALTDRRVKVTLPSPMLAIRLWGEHSRDAYPSPFDLARHAAEIVHGWGTELVAAGCRDIQIDAPELLAAFADPQVREDYYDSQGISSEEFLEVGCELVNAVADLPGATTLLHLCKGNGPNMFIAAGSYEHISTRFFERATSFDGFLLEYDTDRSGGFEPLANLPDDKMAILGLVSTKVADLESPAAIAAAVEQASRFHPRDALGLSPQCGFASAAESASARGLTEQRQFEKLELIVGCARAIWG